MMYFCTHFFFFLTRSKTGIISQYFKVIRVLTLENVQLQNGKIREFPREWNALLEHVPFTTGPIKKRRDFSYKGEDRDFEMNNMNKVNDGTNQELEHCSLYRAIVRLFKLLQLTIISNWEVTHYTKWTMMIFIEVLKY